MKTGELILAKKYARAYFSVFKDQFSRNHFAGLQEYVQFLESRKTALFYLKLTILPAETKINGLAKSAEPYNIATLLMPLFQLLSEHHRLEIIVSVLQSLIAEYKHSHHMMDFTLEVAQLKTMNKATQQEIIQFLEKNTDATVAVTIKENPALIAGLKVFNDDLMWEYSVKRQLQIVRAAYCRE